MIPIRGEIHGVRETQAALSQVPGLIRQAGMKAMTRSLQLVSRTVRDDYLQGPYPTEIERRSGSFRATFARGHTENIWQVQASGTQILGTFGSKDKRARILNDGGIVRSSRPGGYLAIRTEYTKTGRGVVREKYRQSLRNLPNTFVAKGTVFERIGRRIVPIAWLRKFVTIRGRRFMEKTEQKATPGIQAIFREDLGGLLTRLQSTFDRLRGAR
jgi:hypothetical protein